MNKLRHLFSKTLLFYLWQEFLVRYRFKYVLPRVQETVQDGIRLDLSALSLKVRNRILMGIYECHEKRMCQDFLTPQDSVLEIGGAIGFIGLICQKNIGIQHYYIFEANPHTLEVLRANYELNGQTPTAWNVALGPEVGTVDLEIGGDFWENSVCLQNGRRKSEQIVTVPAAPLPSLLRQVGRPVNVLIIDVEGAEQYIDCSQIPPQVDKIIIEIHPSLLGPEKTYELIGSLVNRGYRVAREESGTFVFLRNPVPATVKTAESWRPPEDSSLREDIHLNDGPLALAQPGAKL
jgi:FkbM family methyltransferase